MAKRKKLKSKPKPINALICFSAPIPSTHIRLFSPFKWLVQKRLVEGFAITENEVTKSVIETADAIICQRGTNENTLAIVRYAKSLGKKVIYECDDNFLAIPRNTPIVGEYYSDPNVQELFKALLREADVVTTSTEHLAGCFGEFAESVKVLPNCVDFEFVHPKKTNSKTDTITIGYAGTATHVPDFIPVLPALLRLTDERPDIRLEFLGFNPAELSDRPNVRLVPYDDDYLGFLKRLSQVEWSFAVAPLANELFNLGKTDNKFREYGACKIPSIYSDIPVYGLIRDGETGLLAQNTTESWHTAIKRMVDDQELRNRIARNAYAYVKENYSVKKAAKAWFDLLQRFSARVEH